MKLSEIVKHANGEVLNPTVFEDHEIAGGCGADLMSDVLTGVKPGAVLLTGLCNPQVIRTAEMADVYAVIFLRGKRPTSEMIELATEKNIPIISSDMGMFQLSGRLCKAGLHSLESNWKGLHE
jgi:predicted transcriptional regulator